MAGPRPLLRVGLTGGSASGKSTVAGMLAERGAFVLDADALAHETMVPGGPVHDAIVARFGSGILDAAGRVDRSRLAPLIFSDAAARRDLEALVHPAVLAEVERRLTALAAAPGPAIAVLDAALLVETGAHRRFDRLIVVRCGPEEQLRRLCARDGTSEAAARARIAAQAPLERKLEVADYVIDTGGPLEQTRQRAGELYRELLGDFEREFGRPPD